MTNYYSLVLQGQTLDVSIESWRCTAQEMTNTAWELEERQKRRTGLKSQQSIKPFSCLALRQCEAWRNHTHTHTHTHTHRRYSLVPPWSFPTCHGFWKRWKHLPDSWGSLIAQLVKNLPAMQELLLLLSCYSRVRLCVTPQTAAHQAPPSLGFSRQEHWSGLPFPSPVHESEK